MLHSDRRSDIEVVAKMLRVGGLKTAIMYGANLSYAQTQKYLHLLADLGLIHSVDGTNGRRLYRPTAKGEKFLEVIGKLEELLDFQVPSQEPGRRVSSIKPSPGIRKQTP